MNLRKLCVAIVLASFVATSAAYGSETPNSQPVVEQVSATQVGAGSFFGTLSWSPISGASSYTVYKTGSIRPGWRQIASMSSRTTSMTISDKPGSIAIYRVTAVVSGNLVTVGVIKYFPRR